MKKENLMTQYKGFDTFEDIEDNTLRNRNRAVVLSNIAEDSSRNKKISPGGAGLIIGYFNVIPDADKREVKEMFVASMNERGFQLAV